MKIISFVIRTIEGGSIGLVLNSPNFHRIGSKIACPFASLDIHLNNSLKNEGWSEECEDTKIIVRLWKEFKPSLPGINTFDLGFRHFEYI